MIHSDASGKRRLMLRCNRAHKTRHYVTSSFLLPIHCAAAFVLLDDKVLKMSRTQGILVPTMTMIQCRAFKRCTRHKWHWLTCLQLVRKCAT